MCARRRRSRRGLAELGVSSGGRHSIAGLIDVQFERHDTISTRTTSARGMRRSRVAPGRRSPGASILIQTNCTAETCPSPLFLAGNRPRRRSRPPNADKHTTNRLLAAERCRANPTIPCTIFASHVCVSDRLISAWLCLDLMQSTSHIFMFRHGHLSTAMRVIYAIYPQLICESQFG